MVAGLRFTTPSPHPTPSGSDAFDLAPGDALGYAYDMVLNGNEIGGGSIRIHRTDMQQRVFDVLGLSRDEAREQVRLPARGACATARRRMAASPSGSTGSLRCSPEPRRSAR